MKRVYTLYRVSTVKQVDIIKDDIPMQRIACHEFAEKMGWTIIKEKEEKGISGFKVSASKRDAIQELKDAALNQEFDILLVFMFDRLGRIENETPFILQWFAEHGVEVWSVNEGQQKFEQHVDKLMNYIRFWQASGESEKTSIRVKTRLQQMASEGIFTGGRVPFGYKLVDKGRLNKKGQNVRDLEICPEEANIVSTLYDMVIEGGYGCHQLAAFMNKQGCKTRAGGEFKGSNVLRILKNSLNRGVLSRGQARSEPIPELRIISDAKFFRVAEILEQRNGKNEEKRQIALRNKGQALLAGIIFCGHCGTHLATSREVKKHILKDGTEHVYSTIRYICYHKSRRLKDCDGQSVYNAQKIDEAAIQAIHQIFASITGCPEEEKIQQIHKRALLDIQARHHKVTEEIKRIQSKLSALRTEISNAITGESVYSKEDLASALQELKETLENREKEAERLREEEDDKKKLSEMIIPTYKQFRSWAIEFDEASFEVKKMIASQLFSRVTVYKNYKITFELNFTYRQFCEDWIDQTPLLKSSS